MAGNRRSRKSNRRILEKYDSLKYGWLIDARKFIILIAGVFLVFRLVVGFSFIKGDSMQPALKSGEVVMYFRINAGYRAGDVVSVRVPEGK